MKKILLTALNIVLAFSLFACGNSTETEQKVEETEITEDNIKSEGEKKPDFKAECEKNAENHPAKAGAVLVTKGDYDFTGMDYYFKGELIQKTTIDNIGDSSAWLVKNENGYVMPIQHSYFNAEIGDKIEVWGTLSGNGYSNVEGIDNVVGETGSMHAMLLTVNGEEQY
ncbi:hypothetical protein SAMN00017405_0384 [Desulfonispora thiosulfatigenes DSM 11270]|uniref:Lipoprotein n=1 Tax=Desulfonispora thiosulfatigenes DSM 11270 TaxID=656914 RepID=A0A1W1VPQ5_DESTI|nr:hypothetical protein [Desulfonispora thiosulfatigenes]SMB95338.1 hypothetical protein SAMN00017405_0384 [Desulfonispora thiosulfatigenes DSM 11270]